MKQNYWIVEDLLIFKPEFNDELNDYYLKIKKIPKNLKTVKCNKEYKYINDFKNYEVITY